MRPCGRAAGYALTTAFRGLPGPQPGPYFILPLRRLRAYRLSPAVCSAAVDLLRFARVLCLLRFIV